MSTMDRYALIGNPVAHSLSPRIHEAFAAQTGQAMGYERIEAPLDDFAGTVQRFFAGGGRGCNVTVPFKGEAAHWVSRLDEAAAFAGAVNTIAVDEAEGYAGYNTDGPGLVVDLKRIAGAAENLRVLLLGAGGAARGVARPLLRSLAGELTIANRTPARAVALAERLAGISAVPVRAVPFPALTGPFDLVINATSAGLAESVPEIPPEAVHGALCYDMVYGKTTAFCRWALAAGARRAEDGLGMLVAQAALAFQIWRGVLPDMARVLDQLKEELRDR